MWTGETVSILGSHMTTIALGIVLFERTGRATPLALVISAGYVPALFFAPFLGAAVERFDRRRTLLVSDLAQAITTLALLVYVESDGPALWPVYALLLVAGIANAIQQSAWDASIGLLLPVEHFERASGFESLSYGVANVAAPALGAVVLSATGIGGVLIVDLLTFCFAAAALLLVRIPPPVARQPAGARVSKFVDDARDGWRYVSTRPPLVRLLGVAVSFSFTNNVTVVLIIPAMLARGEGAAGTGVVITAFGVGGVLGGIAVAASGGPRRRIHGVLGAMVLSGLLGQALFGVGRALPVWALASFFNGFFLPLVNASDRATWLARVHPEFHGRALTLRRVALGAAKPVGLLAGGLAADALFVPALSDRADGALEWLFGRGPDSGYDGLFVLAGLMSAVAGALGYASRRMRALDDESAADPSPVVAPGRRHAVTRRD
ncbi:MAG TPA: MFS transporter [Actinomycetota bacterium]|nr:MFS transporter [Actinomycetota bacterium]